MIFTVFHKARDGSPEMLQRDAPHLGLRAWDRWNEVHIYPHVLHGADRDEESAVRAFINGTIRPDCEFWFGPGHFDVNRAGYNPYVENWVWWVTRDDWEPPSERVPQPTSHLPAPVPA